MPERKSNPIDDLLRNQPFPEIAALLREQSQIIMERWESMVREALPTADSLTLAQVRDEVPQTLAKLADALEFGSDKVRELINQTGAHAAERVRQGYNIEELMIEYRFLRRIVIEQVESALSRRTSMAEDLALSIGIDAVVQQGVVAFVNRQNEVIKRASDAEAKFLAFLSHDLRNRLNHATLGLELVIRTLKGTAEYADDAALLDSVQRSITDTIEAMERVLQSERLRKGAGAPKLGPVNLHDVASAVAGELAAKANIKGLGLKVGVPPDATITSDRQLIALVLHNLIHNAVKYSSNGNVRVSAQAFAEDRPEWVLSVSDDGPGIVPEHRERLFQAFERGETYGQPGIGLGLSIVTHAAKALGARVTLDSQPGTGSTFKLFLPSL